MNRTEVLNLMCYIEDSRQVITANYNHPLNLYWLDIPVHKLDEFTELYLCLIRDRHMKVYKVPTDFLREGVRVYKKEQYVSLELHADTLQDRKGLARKIFVPFLLEEKDIVL